MQAKNIENTIESGYEEKIYMEQSNNQIMSPVNVCIQTPVQVQVIWCQGLMYLQ